MQNIYSLRKSFSIIGLTGKMGSGCSKVAEILSSTNDDFFSNEENPRLPDEISLTTPVSNQSENIFKRKYSICYKFLKKNRINYQTIDYKKAAILYATYYFVKNNSSTAREELYQSIIKNFKTSVKDISLLNSIRIERQELESLVSESDFNLLSAQLQTFTSRGIQKSKSEGELTSLYEIFFEKTSVFSSFYTSLLALLTKKNFFIRTLFFHKLSNSIRSSGIPFDDSEDSANIYNMAHILNRLIKAYKFKYPDNCHITIDSLKNSLEVMFFKERYSAFYMIAVNNLDRANAIDSKIKLDDYKDVTLQQSITLDEAEYRCNDFRKGIFSAPDVQNCIQKSEIHVSLASKDLNVFDFKSTSEQLLKYQSLILQPGIITPSGLERCMQIAYNSKFNSGCISRQVGAVVTDSGYSVKAVGWNDTPKDSTPCLLRNMEEVIGSIDVLDSDKSYSPYETQDNPEFRYKLNTFKYTPLTNPNGGVLETTDIPLNEEYAGKTFVTNAKAEYANKIEKVVDQGKNCSFCFKTLQNKYEGEQNQVHTRSLHAEENAMLQITKYGGQPLEGGILFTTASPCELCSKKAYQLGITKIFYIDPYPGISMFHVLKNGFNQPKTEAFRGAIGKSFTKLYEPFIPYKDELSLMLKSSS